MRWFTRFRGFTWVLISSTLLLAPGCGAGGAEGGSSGYGYNGGLGRLVGCLEVTNADASGTHTLLAVMLQDPTTHALLRQEVVRLPPGHIVNLMDVPAGSYEVVGVYEDWLHTPYPPEPPLVVQVGPDLGAAVTFRHP